MGQRLQDCSREDQEGNSPVSLEKEDGMLTETVEGTLRRIIEGLLPDDREEEGSKGRGW